MRTDIRSVICARCIPTGRRCSHISRTSWATALCRMTRWNWRLIEAWVAGGNYIMAMEPHYREALLKKDAEGDRGVGAARAHGSVAEGEHRAVSAACVSDRDGAGRCWPGEREIANLLYRRNVSPALAPVTALPLPDPQKRLALVAANLKPPAPDVVKRILAHAEAGTTLIVATARHAAVVAVAGLKQVRSEQDREYYALGKGQVVAYQAPDRRSERVCSRRDRHHYAQEPSGSYLECAGSDRTCDR